jgi:dTDP-4-dehydrorhamnose reductase
MVMRQIILVTGANGQLGNEFRQLASAFPQFEFIFGSKETLPVHDEDAIRKFFKANTIHFCVNCAAYTAVDKAEMERDMAFRVNAEAPGILAGICRESNCSFIHISTDYVFDGTASTPYNELAATNPQGVYGVAKLQGEKQVLKADPDAIIIRTSWVYSEFGKNFLKTMLRLMKEKNEIGVVNDQVGSPTYAADLAQAIMQIIRKGPWTRQNDLTGVYHYSNEGSISWYEFAIAIKELSHSECTVKPITTAQYPTPAKRPAYSVLDTTKIRQRFGIIPPPWKNSLQKCMDKLMG